MKHSVTCNSCPQAGGAQTECTLRFAHSREASEAHHSPNTLDREQTCVPHPLLLKGAGFSSIDVRYLALRAAQQSLRTGLASSAFEDTLPESLRRLRSQTTQERVLP